MLSFPGVRRLLPQFCSCLPAQAIRVRLADLAPPEGHTAWPRESAECLLELSNAACNLREGAEEHQVGLVARIEGWAKDGVPSVRLFDTVTNSLEYGLELGKELVERRLARHLGQEGQARLASHPQADLCLRNIQAMAEPLDQYIYLMDL